MKKKKRILSAKNQAAVELGRLGGLARTVKLSAARRKEIATAAVNARWERARRRKEAGAESTGPET